MRAAGGEMAGDREEEKLRRDRTTKKTVVCPSACQNMEVRGP